MSKQTTVENTGCTVPVIDFSPFLGDSTLGTEETVAEMSRACREVGFFYLVNHGIDPGLVQETLEMAEAFFAQEQALKDDVAWRSAEENLGYVALGRESLNPNKKGDRKEAFNINEDGDMNPANAARHPANLWPGAPIGFRPAMEAFFERCVSVADSVLYAFATDLRMPPEFFVERHALRDHTMRVLHYPPVDDNTLDESEARAGVHTDYGSITLLLQDDVGGLRVKTRDGEWRDASPVDGAILVNTGDLMQRWTNDYYRSTPHHVGPSPKEHAHRDRYSIAFFCHPNKDEKTEITCLESCCDEQHPPRYKPVSSRNHLMDRLNATY